MAGLAVSGVYALVHGRVLGKCLLGNRVCRDLGHCLALEGSSSAVALPHFVKRLEQWRAQRIASHVATVLFRCAHDR